MNMTEDIFILVQCDPAAEQSQRYQFCTRVEEQVKKVKGISRTFFTGKPDADITAFAKWNENDIQKYRDEIKAIVGVLKVATKIVVPA